MDSNGCEGYMTLDYNWPAPQPRMAAGCIRPHRGDMDVMNSINVVKGWIREFIDLALLFIAVGVVVQIIFGPDVTYFSGITNNLMGFISELGNGGFVGLIALLVIIYVFSKRGD